MKIERRARWDVKWRAIDSVLRSIEDIYWQSRERTVIECFGDSHVKVMRRLNWVFPGDSLRFRTVSVMGATAYGLGSSRSATNARQIFEKRLRKLAKGAPVLFMMGEIDTGFLAWARSARGGRPVDECMRESLDRYVDYLADVQSRGFQVYVCSAPLPTVKTMRDAPDYMRERRDIVVSIEQRTTLALAFNQLLEKHCEQTEMVFVNLDKYSLDAQTGLVKRELLSGNPHDHHYDEKTFTDILIAALRDVEVFLSVQSGVNVASW